MMKTMNSVIYFSSCLLIPIEMEIRRTDIVGDTKNNFDKLLEKMQGKKLTGVHFSINFKEEDGIDQGNDCELA